MFRDHQKQSPGLAVLWTRWSAITLGIFFTCGPSSLMDAAAGAPPAVDSDAPVAAAETPSMPEKNPKGEPREKLREALKGDKSRRVKMKAQSIVDLQAFKTSETQELSAESGRGGKVTLVNLNANINSWYLLTIHWPDNRGNETIHLENPNPQGQSLSLGMLGKAKGLKITGPGGVESICDIWSTDFQEEVRKARDARVPYGALCDGRVYARTHVNGNKTSKEIVVDFLRENVWGGETITTFVKEKLFKDKFLISSGISDDAEARRREEDRLAPLDGDTDPKFKNTLVEPSELGITLKLEDGQKMALGRWYANPDNKGVFVSSMMPGKVDGKILQSSPERVMALDAVEMNATSYLVAFDMSIFDLGFALGTDHPAVDWSQRALPDAIDTSVGGPDGFDAVDPLVTTGMVNPNLSRKFAATFTAGFKRDHGAFKWGPLASINHGSHYGFVEHGVVFSTLNPGLSTLAVFKDGKIELKTWTEADTGRVKDVVFARQNGVPIVEYDEALKAGIPGKDVKSWGMGNWSGSEDSKFRSLRSGVCLQERDGKQFLIYGYFSSVTPSAMARVFQAYHCQYAMHLDMNALEHTYLSVFPSSGRNVTAEHLINGMNVLDKTYSGNSVPRFIGFPDNRDFFYLWRK